MKNLINKKRLSFLNFLILLFVNFNYSLVVFKFNLKKLRFFNSIYEKKIVTKKKALKNTIKKTIYRNVYIFISRTNNFFKIFKTQIIKNNLFRYFKKKSLK